MTGLRVLASFTAALLAVLVGGFVARPTDAVAVYNDECRTPQGARCVEPQEANGWPYAWIYDTPGVSVVHSVHLFEDRARVRPFALNVALVWATVFGAWTWWSRRRPSAVRRPDWRAAARGGAVALVVQVVGVALWQTPLSDGPLRAVLFPLVLPSVGLGAVADGAARGGAPVEVALAGFVLCLTLTTAGAGAGWALAKGRA